MSIEKRIICEYVAGSQAYGLNNPTSDTDFRGVFLVEDLGCIIDPFKYATSDVKCDVSIVDLVDKSYHELRHFINMLRAANSNAVELMFHKEFTKSSAEWEIIRKHREHLLDPEKFYKSLKGYIQSELRLATGERTGKLGGKRQEQVEKYGFSPKNFVQLLRLCWAGAAFFRTGEFPVSLTTAPIERASLMSIKNHPEKYEKAELVKRVAIYERDLDEAYTDNITAIRYDYHFDEAVASRIILECYFPFLQKQMLRPFKPTGIKMTWL